MTINNALILAAGLGSRLGELTKDKPKCLLDVNGSTILERNISMIKACGIEEIYIATGYLHEKIEEVISSEIKIIRVDDYKTHNNLYTLYHMRSVMNENCVIFFADVLYQQEILSRLLNTKSDIALVVDRSKVLVDTMRVIIDGNIVQEVGSHVSIDEADGNFIGMAKFSKKCLPDVLLVIEKMVKLGNHANDYYTVILDKLRSRYEINFLDTNGLIWKEVDTYDDLKEAKSKF